VTSPDRYDSAYVWSVGHEEAPQAVTSAWIDEQISDTLTRCGVRPGLLDDVAGITERRWWNQDMTFDHAATLGAQRAMALAGVTAADVDLLISTSVSKHHLEPSVACVVHHRLGLGAHCTNYDLGNACLGFLNAMEIAASALQTGRAHVVLIVDGEGSRQTQLATIARLQAPTATREDVFDEFASLTLGSGAAAMVMGGPRPGAHRYLGGISRAATQHHRLCIGDLETMRTDTAGLLISGLALAREAFDAALCQGWKWTDCDRYVMHQISKVHNEKLCQLLDVDPARVPLTYPLLGNMGPAAVPYTLSTVADTLGEDERILLMGIGSGLNCAAAELVW
jgi:3-oxoacyl-[acyl-carrier-protein] synthase-3